VGAERPSTLCQRFKTICLQALRRASIFSVFAGEGNNNFKIFHYPAVYFHQIPYSSRPARHRHVVVPVAALRDRGRNDRRRTNGSIMTNEYISGCCGCRCLQHPGHCDRIESMPSPVPLAAA